MSIECVGVLVASDRIGRVIGRGGSGLKRIREEGGVKVQVDSADEPYSASFRRVDFNGTVEACAFAFAIICEAAFSTDRDAFAPPTATAAVHSTITPMVVVPAASIGRVIGKGGENLKRVREQFQVHVAVERGDTVNNSTKVPERVVTLTGNQERMPLALQCILGAIAESKRDHVPVGLPHHVGFMGGVGGHVGVPSFGGCAAKGVGMMVAGPVGIPIVTGLRLQSIGLGEVKVHLHVPGRLVGAILGKQGARVKQTSAESGCKISMTSREACPDRRAVIIGSFDSCITAQEMLYNQLVEAAETQSALLDDLTVTFYVPKEAASAVIGKQAATLKNIRETANVKVRFGRDEICSHRPCCITGGLQQILQAERQIQGKITSQGTPSAATPAIPPGF